MFLTGLFLSTDWGVVKRQGLGFFGGLKRTSCSFLPFYPTLISKWVVIKKILYWFKKKKKPKTRGQN